MHALKVLPDPDKTLSSRNPLIITVDAVLSAAECAELIDRIEAAGPTAAPITTPRGFVMRPDIRNNSRVMFDDPVLATMLFERVKAHVPARLEGDWQLCGANERLRCYRYEPGQYFAQHFDGAFVRSPDEQSLLTFMVYLNACEAGGHTNFSDHQISVAPWAGGALIFNHLLRHEGARVEAGLKYAVRSDLMYRRASVPARPEQK